MVEPNPRRFERNHRLWGLSASEALSRAHVVVFGLGGVGSWAAEALARGGIGHLTLVDFDRVCPSNSNRQLPATEATFGRYKAEVVAERLRDINPEARIDALPERYEAASADRLLPKDGVDFVVDAIDNVTAKIHLLARCVELGLPVVSSMGASARLDPTLVRVTDLYDSHTDQFAKDIRKFLRIKHGVAATTERTGILAVWSTERPRDPLVEGEEQAAERTQGGAWEKQVNGTAAFVTGTFGLVAAGVVIRSLIGEADPAGGEKKNRMTPSRKKPLTVGTASR